MDFGIMIKSAMQGACQTDDFLIQDGGRVKDLLGVRWGRDDGGVY